MRQQIQASGTNSSCALAGLEFGPCSGAIQWHHVWIYAGRQINEPWAIVGACEAHHDQVTKNRDIKQAFERASLLRTKESDLSEYPHKDWDGIKKQLHL